MSRPPAPVSSLRRRLTPVRIQPDDNPMSIRIRKYLTGTNLLLATRPADVGPTSRAQVWRRGPVHLWRYDGGARSHATPVVLVYAMLLRPYILDLVPGRSVIGSLVAAGHDVWLVDWGEPGPDDSATTLDAYIDDDLHAAVATVRETTGSAQVTLLGHCQGGTLSAIYASLHPEEIRNLVLLAAPIDFAPMPPHPIGAWSLWSRHPWYDSRALLAADGNVPAQVPGRATATWSAHLARGAPWLRSARDRMEAGDEGRAWLAACQWVDDTPALSGVAWVQWLADCYQANELVEGRLLIDGRPARLDLITAAVLRISGRRDVVTPPNQNAQRAHMPAAADFSRVHVPAGHVGMVAGPTARSDVYEPLRRWLAPRSG